VRAVSAPVGPGGRPISRRGAWRLGTRTRSAASPAPTLSPHLLRNTQERRYIEVGHFQSPFFKTVRNGKTYAKITDDRPDEPRHRPHIDAGTEIEIPNNKLKWDKSNPPGLGVVFLSRAGYVFCYVQPGGV
jgi:hypothetical protein